MTADTVVSEIRHTVGLDGLVHLGIRGGRIHVQGIAGTDAVVRSPGDGTLDRLQVERGDGSLSIRAASTTLLHVQRGGSETPLDVQVPVGATLVVEAASADVALDGLSGEQRVRTASGDISVSGVGGVITAEAMSGDIRIEVTGSATLDLRTVSGDLAALAGSIRRLRALTTSGDLSIAGRFDGDGPFDVVTVSGDVELAPSEAALRVDVRSITGDLRTDLPHRLERVAGRRSLVIGGGGPLVDVRSTSGDITVVAPRPTAPAPTPATSPATEALTPTDQPAPIEPLAALEPTTTPPDATAPAPMGSSDLDPRLDVLRALERGDISIDAARERLESIDRAEEVDHAG